MRTLWLFMLPFILAGCGGDGGGSAQAAVADVVYDVNYYHYEKSDPSGIAYIACPINQAPVSVGCDCLSGAAGPIWEQDILDGFGWCVCETANTVYATLTCTDLTVIPAYVAAKPSIDPEVKKQEKLQKRAQLQ